MAKASGWMKRAGSVGFHVPDRCCHCRLAPTMNWKFFDMFLATTTDSALTTQSLQVLFLSCRMMPRFGSISPKPPNG